MRKYTSAPGEFPLTRTGSKHVSLHYAQPLVKCLLGEQRKKNEIASEHRKVHSSPADVSQLPSLCAGPIIKFTMRDATRRLPTKRTKTRAAERNVIYQVLIIRLCVTSAKFVANESGEKRNAMTGTLLATNTKVS